MSLTKKLTFSAILTAFSLIAFMLESLFPPLFIPGARLGLSNLFILIAVIFIGVPYGFGVMTVKVILGSLFSGNIFAMIYGLTAGIVSLTIESLLIKSNKFSILAISLTGGVINLLVQNLIFCIVTLSIEYIVYLPYLALIGAIAGLTVGVAVTLSIKFLPKKLYMKN